MRVYFTLDLEDRRVAAHQEDRFSLMTRRILAFLREENIVGTVFAVSSLASAHPELMREIADDGHEIALHGFRHIPLDKLDRRLFREETRRGKATLEDFFGEAVVGYRAPYFSLVGHTLWATDDLQELGFKYSSSVLPARNPIYGYPGAPRTPFRWPNGLLELPCPVAGPGRLKVPFLGGIYFRYLPRWTVELVLRAQRAHAPMWIYCHPYDFDPDEPFFVMPDTNYLVSRLLFMRRRKTFDKVARVLSGRVGGRLGDWLESDAASVVPVFGPERKNAPLGRLDRPVARGRSRS